MANIKLDPPRGAPERRASPPRAATESQQAATEHQQAAAKREIDENLVQLIEFKKRRALRLARINMWISNGMVLCALGASLLSGFGLLTQLFDAKVGGIIAFIPAMLLAVETAMTFHARTNIRWTQVVRLEAILVDHQFRGKSSEEAADALNALDKEIGELWSRDVSVGHSRFWKSVGGKAHQ